MFIQGGCSTTLHQRCQQRYTRKAPLAKCWILPAKLDLTNKHGGKNNTVFLFSKVSHFSTQLGKKDANRLILQGRAEATHVQICLEPTAGTNIQFSRVFVFWVPRIVDCHTQLNLEVNLPFGNLIWQWKIPRSKFDISQKKRYSLGFRIFPNGLPIFYHEFSYIFPSLGPFPKWTRRRRQPRQRLLHPGRPEGPVSWSHLTNCQILQIKFRSRYL